MRRSPSPIAPPTLTAAECIVTLTQLTTDLKRARRDYKSAVGAGAQISAAKIENLEMRIDTYLGKLKDADPEAVRRAA